MSFDFDRFIERAIEVLLVWLFFVITVGVTAVLVVLAVREVHAETLQCGVQEFESEDVDTLCQSVGFLQEGYEALSKENEKLINDIWALEDRLTLPQYRWMLKPKRLIRILRHIRKGEAWAKPEC